MSSLSCREIVKFAVGMAAFAFVVPLFAAEPPKDPYADAVLIDGEPPATAPGSFTIAVLPDTQHYCEKFPEQYLAQTDWIAKNRDARNIACVLHLGDITNDNSPKQWEVAQKAMGRLDGLVPYFMAVGNHDYANQAKGARKRSQSKFSEYFPLSKFRNLPTFGGTYDKEPERMENSYYLFSAGGRDFLVLALEFGPRGDVIRWANEVAAKHKNREAILITHAYMYYDDTRYNWKKYGKKQSWGPHGYALFGEGKGDNNDGEELWEKLVTKHENFIMTLNGHVIGDGLGRKVSKTPAGRGVPQMLVNFQMKPNGGDGWLRLLEFKADRKTVEAIDYSPTRKQCNGSPQNRFSLTLAPVKE
jgi:hypothetical protein